MGPRDFRRPMISDTLVFEHQSHKKPHFRMPVSVKSLFLEIRRNVASGGSRGDAFRAKKQKKIKKSLRNSKTDQQSYENHCFWKSWGSSDSLFASKKGFDLIGISRRRVIKNHRFWKKRESRKNASETRFGRTSHQKPMILESLGAPPSPRRVPKGPRFWSSFLHMVQRKPSILIKNMVFP